MPVSRDYPKIESKSIRKLYKIRENTMPFEYLDHEADMGVAGIGDTLEEAFEEGAKAVFNLMSDVEEVGRGVEVKIECQASEIPTLFVEMINELLAQRDIEDVLFSELNIEGIESIDEGYRLRGRTYGEVIDPDKHKMKTEVKAATYSGLKFEEKAGKYRIQCVVDV